MFPCQQHAQGRFDSTVSAIHLVYTQNLYVADRCILYINTENHYFQFTGASFIDGNDDIENTDITNEFESCIITNEELKKFFKAENLVQTKDSWLMSGADNKNAKCFSKMNNYSASILQGRGFIHYSICIFMKTTHSLLNFAWLNFSDPLAQLEQKYIDTILSGCQDTLFIYIEL